MVVFKNNLKRFNLINLYLWTPMQTLFWAGIVCLAGLAGLITLYLNFLHGDLKRGAVSTYEITDAVTIYFPIEIIIQMILSLLLLTNSDFFGFWLCLPLLMYNVKVLLKKEYKCYALFPRDYFEKEKIEKISLSKTIYYGILLVYTGSKFMGSFLDLLTTIPL